MSYEMKHFGVVELFENKVVGFHPALNTLDRHVIFEDLVREFGVEPYEELNGLFETDDGYTIQEVEGDR